MLPWSWFREIRVCIEAKYEIFRFIFSLLDSYFQYTLISLNQDQGSIFKLRECAQSIFRIKLGVVRSFFAKIQKKIFLKKWPPKKVKILLFFAPPCIFVDLKKSHWKIQIFHWAEEFWNREEIVEHPILAFLSASLSVCLAAHPKALNNRF
jgi:hypothetical protein